MWRGFLIVIMGTKMSGGGHMGPRPDGWRPRGGLRLVFFISPQSEAAVSAKLISYDHFQDNRNNKSKSSDLTMRKIQQLPQNVAGNESKGQTNIRPVSASIL